MFLIFLATIPSGSLLIANYSWSQSAWTQVEIKNPPLLFTHTPLFFLLFSIISFRCNNFYFKVEHSPSLANLSTYIFFIHSFHYLFSYFFVNYRIFPNSNSRLFYSFFYLLDRIKRVEQVNTQNSWVLFGCSVLRGRKNIYKKRNETLDLQNRLVDTTASAASTSLHHNHHYCCRRTQQQFQKRRPLPKTRRRTRTILATHVWSRRAATRPANRCENVSSSSPPLTNRSRLASLIRYILSFSITNSFLPSPPTN